METGILASMAHNSAAKSPTSLSGMTIGYSHSTGTNIPTVNAGAVCMANSDAYAVGGTKYSCAVFGKFDTGSVSTPTGIDGSGSGVFGNPQGTYAHASVFWADSTPSAFGNSGNTPTIASAFRAGMPQTGAARWGIYGEDIGTTADTGNAQSGFMYVKFPAQGTKRTHFRFDTVDITSYSFNSGDVSYHDGSGALPEGLYERVGSTGALALDDKLFTGNSGALIVAGNWDWNANIKTRWGNANEASAYYDGSDFLLDLTGVADFRVQADIEPKTDDTYDLGASAAQWKDLYLSNDINLAEASNIVVGTTTGTKIGTATSQKLGFFNKAPVVQPSAYTPTNVNADRSYNADSTNINEIADVLGTVIADLQSLGLIG
jgi:hypothetical protein